MERSVGRCSILAAVADSTLIALAKFGDLGYFRRLFRSGGRAHYSYPDAEVEDQEKRTREEENEGNGWMGLAGGLLDECWCCCGAQ